GEGIAGTPATISGGGGYSGGDYARGAPGNAGGGGNEHNAGGGGGGNGGAGGIGGSTWVGMGGSVVGGFGGDAFSATSTRLAMGGGGGEGGANNFGDTSGAEGGGIVILHADTILGNSGIITANGLVGGSTAQDGAGGGGAGGSVLVLAVSDSDNLLPVTITANGGDGGDSVWPANDQHGPGGGGGGGVIFTSHTATSTSVAGGSNGLSGDGTGSPAYVSHDATSGGNGVLSSASTSASACLGASKAFSKVDANDLESPWTIHMDLTFENFSDTQISSLSAEDDLDTVFGATGASTWAFTSISTLTAPATGTLAHNASYDGSSDVELLNSGTLEAGESATIRVQFELNQSSGSFDNQITVSGSTSVESYSDLSVDGSDPDDTDNDGNPDEESLSTLDVT
ncbi:MAG: hypothetical protein K8963_11200, partial [Proteobacteria bacterium]|nr:hypothetical protein [Pseudomonadota bacterium]